MLLDDEVQVKMDEILFGNGLQTTLVALISSLTAMIKKRGHSIEGVMVLEVLKGALKGYLGRYEDQYRFSQREDK